MLVTTKPIGSISQTYDNVGNIATKTDGNGNVTTCQYNYANKLHKVINAKNETTTYTYDNAGNRLQQYDGKNNVTEVQYNVRNLPEKRIDGAALQETYNYYADGTMSSKTDRNGITTTYLYDVFGRLKEQSATKNSIEQNVSYTYDNANNQLTMTDSTGTTTRTYDEIGRVLTKTVPVMGTSTYTYDITEGVVGEYSERTVDPAGNVTEKGYDKACRLISVKDAVDAKPTTYTYDGGGRKTSMTYPNGSKTTYAYDNNNRLVELSNNGTSDVYTYTYDNAGNQLTKSEKVNNVSKGTTLYEYDQLNRLIRVDEPGDIATTYEYDAAGNRISERSTRTGLSNYTYNSQNRLVSASLWPGGGGPAPRAYGISYSYDYNGNMTADKWGHYAYDAFNRMISSDGVTYAYNGEGKRVSKTSGDVTINYLYEGDEVVLEKDSNGNVTRNVHGTNLVSRTIVQKQSTTISEKHLMEIIHDNTAFFQYNGHGDVTRLSDFNGNSEDYTYDAFGNEVSKQTNGDVGKNPFRYAGYQYDEESKLYYLNSRYYNPQTGSFLSEDDPSYGDPNDPLSLNLYTYCHNEPVMYTDPSGHSWISTIIGAVIAAGTVIMSTTTNSNATSENSNKPQDFNTIISSIFDFMYSIFGDGAEYCNSESSANKAANKTTNSTAASTANMGNSNVNVCIDDQQIGDAIMINGSVYANAMQLAEALGYEVSITKDGMIILKRGSLRFTSRIKNNGKFVINVRDVVKGSNNESYLSWWYGTTGKFNIVVQRDMKYSPIAVIRSGNKVSITAYLNFQGYTGTMKNSKYTYAELVALGIEQYWRGAFSIDNKNLTVNTTVYSNNYSPNKILKAVLHDKEQEFLQININNKTGRSYHSNDTTLLWYKDWSILNPGKIELFTSIRYTNVTYSKPTDSSPYTEGEFKNLSAHEFAHALGIGDAYGETGKRNAAPAWAAPANDIMRINGGVVSNNDIAMVLNAFMTNKFYRFPEK